MTKEQAVEFFAELFLGEHHIPRSGVKGFGFGWAVIYDGDFATFDAEMLTRLVFLAHDRCVRAEVSHAGMHLRISIWQRVREGRKSQRHPTLETALSDWRKYYPAPASSPEREGKPEQPEKEK